ncbi:glyoxalase [Kaistia sp. 32K]|uniref:VOC family protein n=1 Tax=Kaistia sp. 32K TaxID=2795690 RepID=UPI0019157993|nr:VOC family protein [Kaistia sp. 32K]BCP53260.1 glyoxalase [Kaistia sp. 32K]
MVRTSHIFPVLRYRNPRGAIEFLVKGFGFELTALHEGPDGEVMHAELRLGQNLVMLGGFDPEILASGRTASGGAGCNYVSVRFVDGHHDMAVAAGAKITRPLEDTDYGSRQYGCRDIEGYEWVFGTYDPLGVDGKVADA